MDVNSMLLQASNVHCSTNNYQAENIDPGYQLKTDLAALIFDWCSASNKWNPIWLEAFMFPHVYHSKNSERLVNLPTYFKLRTAMVLTQEMNYPLYRKTKNIDNKPTCVTIDRAITEHDRLLVHWVNTHYPEVPFTIDEELCSPPIGINTKIMTVCNDPASEDYMAVPYLYDLALLGRSRNDYNVLVFIQEDGEIRCMHKALKPLS